MIKNTAWIVARKILGIILIIIGLIALFTPLIPGSWLALIGLELLGVGVLGWTWVRVG